MSGRADGFGPLLELGGIADLFGPLLRLSWISSSQMRVSLLIELRQTDSVGQLKGFSEWMRIVWRQLSWLLMLDLLRSWMCLANQCEGLFDCPVLPLELNL